MCVEVDKDELEGKKGTGNIQALTESSEEECDCKAEEEDGLPKQMLRTGELSDFYPGHKPFPSVFRIITVSTVRL